MKLFQGYTTDGAQRLLASGALKQHAAQETLFNEAEHEAGGIYLFESEDAAQSYLAGPIVAALKASPGISNISAKLFDVLERHTDITRGPVK